MIPIELLFPALAGGFVGLLVIAAFWPPKKPEPAKEPPKPDPAAKMERELRRRLALAEKERRP
jgi:hypothetical protein